MRRTSRANVVDDYAHAQIASIAYRIMAMLPTHQSPPAQESNARPEASVEDRDPPSIEPESR